MMRKKSIFLFFIANMIFPTFVISQSKVDSLKIVLATTTIDTTKINVYSQIANLLQESGNVDSALYYNNQALDLCIHIGNTIKAGRIKGNIGRVYMDKGFYVLAKKMTFDAYHTSISVNDKKTVANALNLLGTLFKINAQLDSAFYYYLEALRINEEIGNIEGLADNYTNIGIIYQMQNSMDSAFVYYNRSLEQHSKRQNKVGIAGAYSNIASYYNSRKEYNISLEYRKKALSIISETVNKNSKVLILLNVGIDNLRLNNYNSAKSYFSQAFQLADSIGNLELLAKTCEYMAKSHTLSNQIDSAKYYLTIGYGIAQNLNNKISLATFNKTLSEFYVQIEDFEKSLLYYKKYTALNDSLLNVRKIMSITENKEIYESEKKDIANKALKQELKNRQIIIYILGVFIFSTILLISLIYRNIKLKHKNSLLHLAIEKNKKIKEGVKKELHTGVGSQLNIIIRNIKEKDIENNFEKEIWQLSELNNYIRTQSKLLSIPLFIHTTIIDEVLHLASSITTDKLKIDYYFECLSGNWKEIPIILAENIYFIIQELVSNSIKEYAECNRIYIKLVKDKEYITIEFQDNGKGYDLEKINFGDGYSSIQNIVSEHSGKWINETQVGTGVNMLLKFQLK